MAQVVFYFTSLILYVYRWKWKDVICNSVKWIWSFRTVKCYSLKIWFHYNFQKNLGNWTFLSFMIFWNFQNFWVFEFSDLLIFLNFLWHFLNFHWKFLTFLHFLNSLNSLNSLNYMNFKYSLISLNSLRSLNSLNFQKKSLIIH